MRLTSVLLRWKKKPPNGSVWKGKYRLYLQITPKHTEDQIHAYQLEERNLFYLRHPYLTLEQAEGHEEALGIPQMKKLKELEERAKTWRAHSYLGDRFGFLKTQEGWE